MATHTQRAGEAGLSGWTTFAARRKKVLRFPQIAGTRPRPRLSREPVRARLVKHRVPAVLRRRRVRRLAVRPGVPGIGRI